MIRENRLSADLTCIDIQSLAGCGQSLSLYSGDGRLTQPTGTKPQPRAKSRTTAVYGCRPGSQLDTCLVLQGNQPPAYSAQRYRTGT